MRRRGAAGRGRALKGAEAPGVGAGSGVPGVGEDRAVAADSLIPAPGGDGHWDPESQAPRRAALGAQSGVGSVSPSLSVSPRLQPVALWLTSALASAPRAEAGPGAEGRKREGRRAVRTLRGAARLLDPKTTRPATPPPGRRVRIGGNGKGVWELYRGSCRQLGGLPGVAVGEITVSNRRVQSAGPGCLD